MKKVLVLVVSMFISISVYAQKPLIKIIDIDGNETKYNLEDISEMNFVKSNMLYRMVVYKHDTTNTFLTLNIKSMEFVDSNKIKINLLTISKILYIGDIDSIIFVEDICSDVTIGTQTWTCKNLDVDHYRNGDPIPEVTDPIEWANLKTGAWCYYNNDPILGAIYGKLYNWYAVNDSRGLAPEGWHVATDAEWQSVSGYLGGEKASGGKLKSTGTLNNGDGLWYSPNKGASNESGFSALPYGQRGYQGTFDLKGYFASWWTYAEFDSSQAWLKRLYYDDSSIGSVNIPKNYGLSIRCVKDSGIPFPKINTVSPNPISIGDILIITGENFGTKQDTNYVRIYSNKLWQYYYQSWSEKEIKIEVPKGSNSGIISVTVNNIKSYDVVLEVNTTTYKPNISSISPNSAPIEIEAIVTIYGSHFGSLQGNDYVLFDTIKPKKLDYLIWSDSAITVKVPKEVLTCNISVMVNSKKSNRSMFTINGIVTGTVNDIDSNIYKTVKLGTQWWSAKNYNVAHYRNGDTIPQVTDSTKWANAKTGAWCYYNNDPKNGYIYGKLYNWYAVNDPRGLAPEGWHIPNDLEWTQLSEYLGGDLITGGKLKAVGTQYWPNPNTGANNVTEFSAISASCRDSISSFPKLGSHNYLWSSTESNSIKALYRNLSAQSAALNKNIRNKVFGFSVRLVKDFGIPAPIINSTSPETVSIGDYFSIRGKNFGSSQDSNYVSIYSLKIQESDYQSWSDTEIKVKMPKGDRKGKVSVTVNGRKSNDFDFTVINTSYPPKILKISPNTVSMGDTITITGENFGLYQGKDYVSFNIIKPKQRDYIRWSDTEIIVKLPFGATTGKLCAVLTGTKSNEVDITVNNKVEYGTVYDIDSNLYITVKIGDQWWTAENYYVSHYFNGDTIDHVTSNTKWANLKTGAWCYYQNDIKNGDIYGKLYNWYAVNDPRGLAPEGWHVATDAEWQLLSDYLGGDMISAGKLKSTGNRETGDGLWKSPNTGATNESGFSLLPSDDRDYKGAFNNTFGSGTQLWSATGYNASEAWTRYAVYREIELFRGPLLKQDGFPIRCVKGAYSGSQLIKSITPDSAECGEVVTISGTAFGSPRGLNFVSFNTTLPLSSDYISWNNTEIKVKVPQGATSGKVYISIKGLKSNEVDFKVISKSVISDIDGNFYKTVKIGNQWWTAQNLNVSHYRNGDPIPEVKDSAEWAKLTTGAWCYYNNDPNNGTTYGKIYNWYAINDSRGLTPVGWHVPSDSEWTVLTDFLGKYQVAGGKLKTTGTIENGDGLWHTPNESATNDVEFSAIPGGYRLEYGEFNALGYRTIFWSSTEIGPEIWIRMLDYKSELVMGIYGLKQFGCSVRCVKD